MAQMDVSEIKRLLVFGKNGQVAQELACLKPPHRLAFCFAGREDCDLLTADPGALISEMRPAGVINASAYTAVDKAESEPDAAFRLNRDAVALMARACASADIPFLHISTDYVFDGAKTEPYVETDPRNPISIYGASKAAGEEAIEAAGGRWTIFRTAWVFSPFGANFVKTMRRLASEREEIAVVADQHGRPTLAADIAATALEAVRRDLAGDPSLRGLFHLAGADDAVWADVAERVFEDVGQRTGRRPRLKRITTAEYPTPAARPANSRLDTSKLQAAGWSPRSWGEAVDLCLAKLQAG
jgi:dTDP-4-dehydrorhamnose reductase